METAELLVWLRDDVARVELRVPRKLLAPSPEPGALSTEAILLDNLSDRWAIEDVGDAACVWFEIDRRVTVGSARVAD